MNLKLMSVSEVSEILDLAEVTDPEKNRSTRDRNGANWTLD